jgi:hypothetical protein
MPANSISVFGFGGVVLNVCAQQILATPSLAAPSFVRNSLDRGDLKAAQVIEL